MNKLFFSIHGRIGRAKYLYAKMILISIAVIIVILGSVLFAAVENSTITPIVLFIGGSFFAFLIGFYVVGTFVVTVKRFHDFNQSGWLIVLMILLPLFVIPSVTAFLDIILFFTLLLIRGNYGYNLYGPSPIKSVL